MMPIISDSSSTLGSEGPTRVPSLESASPPPNDRFRNESPDGPEIDDTKSHDTSSHHHHRFHQQPESSLRDSDDVSSPADCAGCGGCILDRYYLLAVDRRWHTSCLKCVHCKISLDSEVSCFTREGRIYCKDDYYKMFAVKRCTRCGQDIYASDLVMRVRDNVYHLGCFTCAWCNVTLCPGDYFGLIGNLVYCRAHYTIRSFHQGNNHISHHNHHNSHGMHSPCSESMEYTSLSSEHAIHPASGNHHHSTIHHHRLSPSSGHHPLGSQHQAHLHMGQQVGGSLDHPIPPPHSLYGSVYGESLSSLTAMAGVTDSMNSGSAGFTRGNHALHHHHQQNDGHAPPPSMTPTNSSSPTTTASSTTTSAPPPSARKGRPRKRKISINPSAGADASSPSSTTPNSYCSGLSSVDLLVSKDHSGTSSITGQCISLLDGGLSSSSQTPPNLPSCDLYIHSDGSTSSNGQLNSNGTTTGRTKRMRTSFKHHQLRTMKQYFAINQNPDAKDLKALAQKTNLSKRVLQVWFQNARAKWRRNNLKLQEGGHLSSSSADRSVSYPPSSGMTETTELTNPSTPSPSTTSPSVISCMMYE